MEIIEEYVLISHDAHWMQDNLIWYDSLFDLIHNYIYHIMETQFDDIDIYANWMYHDENVNEIDAWFEKDHHVIDKEPY